MGVYYKDRHNEVEMKVLIQTICLVAKNTNNYIINLPPLSDFENFMVRRRNYFFLILTDIDENAVLAL